MVKAVATHYAIEPKSRTALLKLHAQAGVPSHPLSWKLAVQLRDFVHMDKQLPNYQSLEVDLQETIVSLHDIMLGPPLTPALRRHPRRDRRSAAHKDRVEEAIDQFVELVKQHYRQ